MTEDEVRKVVVFVRSHMPGYKKSDQGDTWITYLYNRRSQLLKGSREHSEQEDELYIRDYMNDKEETSL